MKKIQQQLNTKLLALVDIDEGQLPQHLVSAETLAEYLGVDKKCVYWWVHSEKIPFIKLPKYLRFDPTEVLKALKEPRQQGGVTNA